VSARYSAKSVNSERPTRSVSGGTMNEAERGCPLRNISRSSVRESDPFDN
jgi:hypothetical protein